MFRNDDLSKRFPQYRNDAPRASLFQNVRIIESLEFNLRNEVHERAYLVADRINECKTRHHRYKENVYPHESRFNNKLSNLIQLCWDFSIIIVAPKGFTITCRMHPTAETLC